jgi:trans-aconitate methyltransferase
VAERIAERFRWAVETLALDPADQVLEIGCGTGAAVSLICERLTSGRITAIDRSAAMVEQARNRNRAHIVSGKAVIETVALEVADFGPERFDKIFAFNVSLFWNLGSRELSRLRLLLQPHGAVCLFHQPPMREKTLQGIDVLNQLLPEHGFAITEVLVKEMRPAPAVCVRARRSDHAT